MAANKKAPAKKAPAKKVAAKKASAKTAAQKERSERIKRRVAKRPPWRPTLLSKEITDEIVSYISEGLDYKSSVDMAGIATSTFYTWMREAEHLEDELQAAGNEIELTDHDSLLLEFRKRVRRAQGEAKRAHVACLMRSAQPTIDPSTGEVLSPGDYRASVEYLKRRDPKNWGDTEKREITVKSDNAQQGGVLVIPGAGAMSKSEFEDYMRTQQQATKQLAEDELGDLDE